MANTYPRFVFTETENGPVVRSLVNPRRGEAHPRVLLSAGRWPSGESLAGSDAYDIARYLHPVKDKRATNGGRHAHCR